MRALDPSRRVQEEAEASAGLIRPCSHCVSWSMFLGKKILRGFIVRGMIFLKFISSHLEGEA